MSKNYNNSFFHRVKGTLLCIYVSFFLIYYYYQCKSVLVDIGFG